LSVLITASSPYRCTLIINRDGVSAAVMRASGVSLPTTNRNIFVEDEKTLAFAGDMQLN